MQRFAALRQSIVGENVGEEHGAGDGRIGFGVRHALRGLQQSLRREPRQRTVPVQSNNLLHS